MTYATLAGLIERLGADVLVQITDRATPPAGAIDQGVVDRALADTDAAIDAALAVRYRLPLATVPAMVADIALSIASYKAHRFTPEQKIVDDYNQALKDLRELGAGTKKLDVAGVEPTSSGAGGVLAIDRERPLTPETMTGFI